jgi:hypothetical protein
VPSAAASRVTPAVAAEFGGRKIMRIGESARHGSCADRSRRA